MQQVKDLYRPCCRIEFSVNISHRTNFAKCEFISPHWSSGNREVIDIPQSHARLPQRPCVRDFSMHVWLCTVLATVSQQCVPSLLRILRWQDGPDVFQGLITKRNLDPCGNVLLVRNVASVLMPYCSGPLSLCDYVVCCECLAMLPMA